MSRVVCIACFPVFRAFFGSASHHHLPVLFLYSSIGKKRKPLRGNDSAEGETGTMGIFAGLSLALQVLQIHKKPGRCIHMSEDNPYDITLRRDAQQHTSIAEVTGSLVWSEKVTPVRKPSLL